MSFFASYPVIGGGSGGSGVTTYPSAASFPLTAPDGTLAIALDNHVLYEFNANTSAWQVLSTPGSDIYSINGDATSAQVLTTGSLGTDFAVVDNGIGGHAFNLPTASGTNTGKLSSTDWTTFNSKVGSVDTFSATPTNNGLTISGGKINLTIADATHPGAISGTYYSNFSSAYSDTSSATSSNTVSTIVKRDSSGNFSAGTITASLSGNATSATTATTAGNVSGVVALDHGGTGQITAQLSMDALAGAVTSGSYLRGNGTHVVMSGIQAADVPTLNQSTSGTASAITGNLTGDVTSTGMATTYSGTVPLNKGGTGQITKAASFDALSPMTTGGDLIYGGTSGTGTRLANGSANQFLASQGTTLAPTWKSFAAPTFQIFTDSTYYTFTVTSANATAGATYTNNSKTFTVITTISGGTTLLCSSTGAPASSGTLTKSGGTGDSTISFSAQRLGGTYTTPANVVYLKVTMIGGGAGGSGSGTASGGNSSGMTATTFGAASAGAGGAGSYATQPGGVGGTASLGGLGVGIAINGSGGGPGMGGSGDPASLYLPGGVGGASSLGGAGGGGSSAGVAAATNSGSGGSGANSNSNAASSSGPGGGSGATIITTIASPSATYTYAVGSGGVGGTAGTSGNAGGAGAAGIIIVEEHYV